MEVAVLFDNVTKSFFIGHRNHGLKETVIDLITRQPATGSQHFVLKNASFHVEKGETFGIIGQNGVGKSTILKLVARILVPNSGRIIVRGRVSSLLEVGAGFQPDLTGRENVFLYGAILGMTRRQMESRFRTIINFSELQRKFLDVPVKHYSSGMYMRLAFSVAVHVEPDILVADEVLSVGDIAFQQKCIEKIEELRSSGTTILFVSHDLQTVGRICKRALLVSPGGHTSVGPADTQISTFVSSF